MARELLINRRVKGVAESVNSALTMHPTRRIRVGGARVDGGSAATAMRGASTMRKLKLAAAAVALASAAAAATGANAQAYGWGAGPTPAYASGGEAYAPYDTYNRSCDGFTLAGARAGVTVLGINLDGGAGVRLSAGESCHGGRRHHHERPVAYAPPPLPPPQQYAPEPEYAPAPPAYGYGGGYATGYSYPTYAPPCGCGW